MDRCSHCGATPEPGVTFCSDCGARLDATQVLPVGAFSAHQLVEQAVALVATGNAPAAAAKGREALRLAPGLAAAHAALGRALERMGKDAEALAAYEEALRLDPGRAAERTHAAALRQRLAPVPRAPAVSPVGAPAPAPAARPAGLRVSKRAFAVGAAVAVLLFVLGAALVWARASGPDRTTRRQYERQMALGRELYAQGEYAGARDAFLAAMEATPRSVDAQRRYNDAAMMAGSRPTALLTSPPPPPTDVTIKLQDGMAPGDAAMTDPLFPPPATPPTIERNSIGGPPAIVSQPAGDDPPMPPPVVPPDTGAPVPLETTRGGPGPSSPSGPPPSISYTPEGGRDSGPDLWPAPGEDAGSAPKAATPAERARPARIVVEFREPRSGTQAPTGTGQRQAGSGSSGSWEANPGHTLRRQADQLRQQGRAKEAAQRYREARGAFEADPAGGSMRTQALSSVDKALRLLEQQSP